MTTSERSQRMRLAAHKSWGNTVDRASRTAAARKASHHTRFLNKAREMHPNATAKQIEKVAESLRSAHYTELALKSAQARRIKSEQAKTAKRKQVAQEIAALSAGRPAAA
ncbi:hypothetical protein [Streptomyces scopuliridis]|uniref:Uncharacterized protein n=1 Tax=Streptomyces scopuliridis RB72 TaxID=1440053 RepID=A0A2T7SP29_9ACTN|nr:hypothetical protein [Streptomyces scopuliridis]PVE04641.1 hypothetical protein Y717_10625 [Streptomyces scopuliridis RB72]